MFRHLITTLKDTKDILKIAEQKGVNIQDYKVIFLPIKYVLPSSGTHDRLVEQNWGRVHDILTNGSLFDELIVIQVDSLEDLNELSESKRDKIKTKCLFIG